MTDFLIEHQKLLDRLNTATENLRQATRDRIRAEDQENYWRQQIAVISAQLDRDRTE
jgi:septal ring factor EnvC (AmiA/AmiB activator)